MELRKAIEKVSEEKIGIFGFEWGYGADRIQCINTDHIDQEKAICRRPDKKYQPKGYLAWSKHRPIIASGKECLIDDIEFLFKLGKRLICEEICSDWMVSDFVKKKQPSIESRTGVSWDQLKEWISEEVK